MAVILTACETDKNSSEINIEPKKATPNAEELILSNAQKTVQLQDQLLDEAEHFLATMNIEVDDNFTQKVQKSSKSEDPAINAKLDSLMQVFESQRPMPVERLFDTDSIPSGLTENDRYIILGDDNMIDKADPSNALMLSNIVRVSKGMEPIEENSQMAKSIFKSRKALPLPMTASIAPLAGVVRIIGIDPGSRHTGIGIIDADAAGRSRHVFHTALNLAGSEDFACGGDAFRPRIGGVTEPHAIGG